MTAFSRFSPKPSPFYGHEEGVRRAAEAQRHMEKTGEFPPLRIPPTPPKTPTRWPTALYQNEYTKAQQMLSKLLGSAIAKKD